MAIPETQLVTWSHQGSIAQSAATYEIIKDVLEAAGSPYAGKNFTVFLQGSYANDTNIRDVESDVDVVVRLDDTFSHDLADLGEAERTAFHAYYKDATYSYDDFKGDVTGQLKRELGSHVKPGKKAIKIAPSGNRRAADVLVTIQHRRYSRFRGGSNQTYVSGIAFYTSTGDKITNFPAQHAENCTRKHQITDDNFKPLIRIFKNARNKLVSDRVVDDGLAPSYFIDGLLYNVPPACFVGSYGHMFATSLDWIASADRSEFVCANEQYYLLRYSPVTWRAENCTKFLGAMRDLWANWD